MKRPRTLFALGSLEHLKGANPHHRMRRFLLIDNSNSFTKFAVSCGEKIGKVQRIATKELSLRRLRELLEKMKFDAAVVCSVVPHKATVIEKALGKRAFERVSDQSPLGLNIDYPKPASIGADRLANACAVAAHYRTPAVVVDFGTAVSFDIINTQGHYIGGVIAPGLEAMTDYLHQRTALLPKLRLIEPPDAIGKSTTHAMLAGAVYGYRGLVREILRQIHKSLGVRKPPLVIATGGYAELISVGLPEISKVHPTLTLEGLRLIAMRKFHQDEEHI
jgi:type III pantothenate kinase